MKAELETTLMTMMIDKLLLESIIKDSNVISYLLQEIGNALPFRTLEATRLKKFHHMLQRPVIHNLAFRKQQHVVEEVECLRSRLQERDEDSGCHLVCKSAHVLHNLVRRGAVQACGDFVHEQHPHWAHSHLP